MGFFCIFVAVGEDEARVISSSTQLDAPKSNKQAHDKATYSKASSVPPLSQLQGLVSGHGSHSGYMMASGLVESRER